jgi:hypothetical protein
LFVKVRILFPNQIGYFIMMFTLPQRCLWNDFLVWNHR